MRGKKNYGKPFEFDPSPLYAVEVNEDGTLDHSGAYDPLYYERCDECEEVYVKAENHDCPSLHSDPAKGKSTLPRRNGDARAAAVSEWENEGGSCAD